MNRSVAEKMGITSQQKVAVINGPAAAVTAIQLPVEPVADTEQTGFDQIIYFVTTQEDMDRNFPRHKEKLAPTGKLWVAWPKARTLPTDLNLKEVIRIGYNHSLVESVNLRVDDTWTALKFTFPKPGKSYHNSYGKLPDS
jgi:hypothetical protein